MWNSKFCYIALGVIVISWFSHSFQAQFSQESSSTCHNSNVKSSNISYVLDKLIPKEDESSCANRLSVFPLIKSVIKLVYAENKITLSKEEEEVIRVHAVGSYYMGTHFPEDDLDILCILPAKDKLDFISNFCSILMRQDSDVKHLEDLHMAKVPIVKTICKGISVDIVFAFTYSAKVYDELSDEFIYNLNRPGDVASVSSRRNGLFIQSSLLAVEADMRVFQTAAKFIRFWAKRRGIYNSKLGYLSGITISLLLYKICCEHPKDDAEFIVRKFFNVYSEGSVWSNPFISNSNVRKLELRDDHSQEFVTSVNALHFDFLQPIVKKPVMAILTPTFPCISTTTLVSTFTRRRIENEFKRAKDLVSNTDAVNWEEILQPETFFKSHEIFWELKYSSTSEILVKQLGEHTESQARNIFKGLEKPFFEISRQKENFGSFCGIVPFSSLILSKTYLDGESLTDPNMIMTDFNWTGNLKTIYTASIYVAILIDKGRNRNITNKEENGNLAEKENERKLTDKEKYDIVMCLNDPEIYKKVKSEIFRSILCNYMNLPYNVESTILLQNDLPQHIKNRDYLFAD